MTPPRPCRWKIKAENPDSGFGGFTRILHSGHADNLMDEIPTVVVDTLPAGINDEVGGVVCTAACIYGTACVYYAGASSACSLLLVCSLCRNETMRKSDVLSALLCVFTACVCWGGVG